MSEETTRVMSDADMDATERLAEARLAEARTRSADPEVEARVHEYLRRPYRMEIRGSPEEGYLATAPELPGCITAGETPEEALRMLRDAMASWIEAAIVAGDPIPEPDGERHGGRVLLRMPKSLHVRLADSLGQNRERLLANLERALGISSLAPGPEQEAHRILLQITRAVLAGDPWSPALDTPGSESVVAINAYLRLIASLPPEVIQELRRRFDALAETFGRPIDVGLADGHSPLPLGEGDDRSLLVSIVVPSPITGET